MKKLYAAIAALLIMPVLATAQTPSSAPLISSAPIGPSLRAAGLDTCGVDTSMYVWSKATQLLGVTMNVPSEFSGYSQYWDAPQEMTVYGFSFYAGTNSVNPADSAMIVCTLRDAMPDSTPGSVLATDTVWALNTYDPLQPGQMKITVIFNSPVIVNGPYHTNIQTWTNLPLGVLSDDYNAGDGGMEELGFWHWTGDSTWYPSNEFFAWDVDWMMESIVEYETWAAFQMTTDTLCAPDSVCMMVDSIAPIYYNRMYNQNALNATAESGFDWIWGDGSGNSAFDDTCHTYLTEGFYQPRLAMILVGWTVNCTMNVIDSLWVLGPPNVSFTSSSNEWTADFTESLSGSAADSIWWDFGDSNTMMGSNPSHTYADTGTYTVCLFGANMCGTDTACNPITITCTPPAAGFDFSIDTVEITFTDTSMGQNVTSWSWDFGDSNTSTMQNPVHNYGASGTYTVCLTVTDDCNTDSVCTTINVIGVGMSEHPLDGKLSLYPVPANDVLTLQTRLDQAQHLTTEIIDLTGRVVAQRDLGMMDKGVAEFAIESLAAGHYVLKVKAGEAVSSLPFVKK